MGNLGDKVGGLGKLTEGEAEVGEHGTGICGPGVGKFRLFRAERDHRIDFRGAARGEPAGEEAGDAEE